MAEAPHMHPTPVPAFPAVGVVLPIGEAHQVHETVVGAGAIAQDAPEVMRTRGGEDRCRSQLSLEPNYLVGNDAQSLVPADGLVPGDSTVLSVPIPIGVEIHPLERGEDALGRVDGRLTGGYVRGDSGPPRGREITPPRVYGPRGSVAVVQFERDDAEDLAVLHINVHRPSGGEICEPDYRFHIIPCFFSASVIKRQTVRHRYRGSARS
jgi:hypothetical protein